MIASPEKIEETERATWADRPIADDIWRRAQDLMALEAESGRTIHREIWMDVDRISIRNGTGETLCFLQMDDRSGDDIILVTSKTVVVPSLAVTTLKMILNGYLH